MNLFFSLFDQRYDGSSEQRTHPMSPSLLLDIKVQLTVLFMNSAQAVDIWRHYSSSMRSNTPTVEAIPEVLVRLCDEADAPFGLVIDGVAYDEQQDWNFQHPFTVLTETGEVVQLTSALLDHVDVFL